MGIDGDDVTVLVVESNVGGTDTGGHRGLLPRGTVGAGGTRPEQTSLQLAYLSLGRRAVGQHPSGSVRTEAEGLERRLVTIPGPPE